MEHSVQITDGAVILEGVLKIPENARGIVLFAHGSGSSRHSPRNVFVAQELYVDGLGTLLIDLLSETEDVVREARFDISHLAQRLVRITKWLQENELTADLAIGLFGASTGAAAALRTAAMLPGAISAVVSRGGRPDLTGPEIALVEAPTLLIVGGNDWGVVEFNELAYEELTCEKKIAIVTGATHLFEEPGTLEEAAGLAKEWFKSHLH